MSGTDTIWGRRACTRTLLLWSIGWILSCGWVLPTHAQTGYFSAPYTNHWDGIPYASAAAAVQAYIGETEANCNKNSAPATCFYSPTYVTPTQSGTVALVNWGWQDPNGSRYWGSNPQAITGTYKYYDSMKVSGGPVTCVCDTSHVGGNHGGSSPHGGSGDSALDSQPIGAAASFEIDPINVATGNKYEQDTDFRGSSWLTFRRFYNSKNYVISAHLGPQWRHSFDRALEIERSPAGSSGSSFIILDRPDGAREQFTLTNGVWVAQGDNPDTLTEEDDASGNPIGYTASIAGSRHTEAYNASGLLQSVTDPTGQGITLTYSTTATPVTVAPKPNLLLTVTDTGGRQLSFIYNSNGTLSQVTQPDDGTLIYGYDASTGQLTSVQYPDGKTRQYVYNEASLNAGTSQPSALTGVVDEGGVRFESTGYASNGNAVSTSFAGGVDAASVSYSSNAASATLRTPLGTSLTFNFTGVLGAYKPGSTSLPCGTQCNESLKSSTYDANGYPQSTKDFNGNVTGTTYDINGLLDQEIDATGTANQRTTKNTWNTALRLPLTRVVLDNNGNTVASTAWVYDSTGQTLAKCEIDPTNSAATGYTCSNTGTVPAGVRRSTYTYCTAVDTTQCPIVGLLLTTTGPRTDLAQTTTYAYYLTDGATAHHGDLKSMTDALGHTTTYLSYDGAGRVLSQQDTNGVVTAFTYYPRGWLKTLSIGGATTTYTYTAYGAVATVTDPDNVTVTYGYDTAHRLTTITDAQGNYIQYTLDVSGNRIAENTYASGSSTPSRTLTRKFNTLGQLTQSTDGLGHVIFNASGSGSYDANGNLVQSTDASGYQTQRTYDTLNRLVKTIENYNGSDTATRNTTTVQTQDALDRLTGVTDPSNLTTTYVYDGLSNATSLQSPDTGASNSTYDAAGNVLTRTDAKGITATISYDALNRRTGVSYTDTTQNIAYSYDEANSVTGCSSSSPIGRLTRIVEATVTTVYCYDARGNVITRQQVTSAATDSTAYTYSAADRLNGITYPSGSRVSYGFDGDGRIQTVSLTPVYGGGVTAVSSVSYLPFGPVGSYTLGNGQAVTRSYDTNYRLTDLTSPALNLHFARNAMGDITALGNAPGANPAAETYTYDPLYRLTTITEAGGTVLESATYNPTGDRTSKSGSGLATGSYSYNPNTHQLIGTGTATRSVDANGNTTAIAQAGVAYGFGYNARDRLTVAQLGGSTVGGYTYNALGQRIGKSAASTERFVYGEGSQLLSEYGTSNRDYVWLGDLPVATVDTSGMTSAVSYVTADHLGTPRAVADSSGNTVWQWAYQGNPWGELQPASSGYTLNLRYPGQYFDSESGLADNINRAYDTATGRYIQSDPIGLGGGLSTYAYVDNNPLSNIDPSGTQILVPIPENRSVPLPIPDVPRPTHNYPKDDPVALCLAMGSPCIVPAAAAAMAGGNVLPFPTTKPMAGTCPKDDGDGNDRCEKNLKRDLLSCKAVGKRGGKQVYEVCRQQAMVRYGNCLSGRDSDVDAPLPPW